MFTLDTHPLCCKNHTSPPVANFARHVCVLTLPGWSFFVSAVFLNSSGTFWTRNTVHYLLQQYLTTFFRSPEKLLHVDYCCFHNEPFIYVCVRSYDTSRSFELIFMKFTRLVRVHPWVNPIVFGNNQPNRTTDMGENVPQNQFFGFKSDGSRPAWLNG